MIPGLAPALFAVLDGFRWASADARHAVGAVAVPDRLAVLDCDVVRRAKLGALTAAGAGIASRKGSCFDEERIEDWIHRAAHEAVIEVVAGRRERLIRRDGGNHTVNTFVQDEGWYTAARRYEDFLHRHRNGRILFLELGVGSNTPGIIKVPFLRMTAQNPKATYACINLGEAVTMKGLEAQSILLDADISSVLSELR